MDLLQCAVPAPQAEIAIHRATRWQVFGNVAPRRCSDIHHAIDHLAHVHRALATAAFACWDQRLDLLPLRLGQIARVAQLVAAHTSALSCVWPLCLVAAYVLPDRMSVRPVRNPPSTSTTIPVMKSAASETRNATASAMLRGSPRRPSGIMGRKLCLYSGATR